MMSGKDKWIRRFSVDETAKHKNGFTIYKITSILFPIDSPEAVTSVSVWKRYSDVQRLHKSMKSLHSGLHLRGTFPTLPRYSYFKRFQQEVIDERAKTIKSMLEFVADHRLLFTSTEFVNFLQTGYPPPPVAGGVISCIRSSLQLPLEDAPPLEYQTDDDDARSPAHSARQESSQSRDETDFISQIPIYEAADVEIRESPKKLSQKSNSFESITSIESIDSDLYEELNKMTVHRKPIIRKMLPDLITFDAPSTSNLKFEDYHTMGTVNVTANSDNVSLSNLNLESNSMCDLERRSSSKLSLYSKRSVLSLSNVDSKTKTEDSYVFEAGYMLNLAARCENIGDYQRAFECYKSGIEKMLIGVQTDTDAQRRAFIKDKTNKFLSYAEEIYKKHLSDPQRSLLCEQASSPRGHCPIPLCMLRRDYEELALYRVLGVLGSTMMLVMHANNNNCYAIKVLQKVPNNLTEFDEYFLQRTSETRTPILPTVIPYMVPLQGYIETKNLIFLILSYAPGEKLFDYIKKYAKSTPTSPKRELNLENVFSEPKKKTDIENNMRNDNGITNTDSKVTNNDRIPIPDRGVTDNATKNSNDSRSTDTNNRVTENDNLITGNDGVITDNDVGNRNVDELVLKSQKLLRNVDRALSDTCVVDNEDVVREEVCDTKQDEKAVVSPCREILPSSAVVGWAAEILTALESLHNAGVICRDLNPSNILLAEGGQVILTYFFHYESGDMSRYGLRARPGAGDMYVAPELLEPWRETSGPPADFWSFGAVLYYLICGVPLSCFHRSAFTSHTILHVPDGLTVEEESVLTQLLTYEPTERLGGGKDGIQEIKSHPYFKNINWTEVYNNWIVPD